MLPHLGGRDLAGEVRHRVVGRLPRADLIEQPHAHDVDETGQFNWPAVRKMGPIGLLGLTVPEAYGGAGVDSVSAILALEEIGWACGSTALALTAHNG